jgi:hypothetical protein
VSDEPKKPADEPSPLWKFGLELLGRMPTATKQAMVDSVAETLQVRPGFWAPDGEAPTENAAALVDLGESRFVVAYWNGKAWLAYANAQGAPEKTIDQPVKRWAVIPG